MASHSMYREDFQAWDSPPKVHPYRPRDNLKVNTQMFADTAASRDSCWQMSDATPVRESFKLPPSAREVPPFDGTTNYRSHFSPHPVQPRRPWERPTYQPNAPPPTRVSTSPQDFRDQPWEMAKSFKPKLAWERNQATFGGTTTQPGTQVRIPPAGDTALLSTSHADFREHHGFHRAKSARPARETWVQDLRPPEPSVMRSTTREDFQAWATERRAPVVPRPQMERAKGPFARMTTTSASYTPKVAQRSLSCKPPHRPLITGPLMERDSVYRASYTARLTPRRRPEQGGGGGTPGLRCPSVETRGRHMYAGGVQSCFFNGGGAGWVGVGAKIGS